MSNKIVIGIIVVLIVIGIILLLINRPNPNNSGNQTNNQQNNPNKTQGSNEQTTNYGEVVTIQVTKSGFEPQSVTVKKGVKVIWTNVSDSLVSVHSSDHPTHLVYPPLNLGEFQRSSSVQLTFEKAGTFRYHDHLKPEYTGTIIVQ